MISFLIGLFNPLGKLLKFVQTNVNSETERQRIQAQTVETYVTAQAATIQAGMQSKLFWIPWLMAAIPTAAWFGWGMLDSLCNGALPDVAALPPQLKFYADVVWNNLFLSGGGVVAATTLAKSLSKR